MTFRKLLQSNLQFRRLWFAQIVSELGNWFTFIAELGLVRMLAGDPVSAGIIVSAHMLPFCLLGPIAGALADRIDRRRMMLVADIARAVVSLGFLLVRRPEHLWIAYTCAGLNSVFTAFFEAAKNAAMPNLARGEQLLPANALMHATRFLQLTAGTLLGGIASELFGYDIAFALNALSFVVSAWFIWRIPADALVPPPGERAPGSRVSARSLGSDLGEAFAFVRTNRLVLAIVLLNLGWALGGGMMMVINDRFGGVIFAEPGASGDRGVSILVAAGGIGLFCGMLVARRAAAWVTRRDAIAGFMGWSVVGSGLLFAIGGLMPNIWLMGAFLMLNRTILAAEYAVQETVLMLALPDSLRGKVFTIDRSIELAVVGGMAVVTGGLFTVLPPRSIPVLAGVLMALPGLFWLLAVSMGRLQVSRRALAG